jgi:hypothetical protein
VPVRAALSMSAAIGAPAPQRHEAPDCVLCTNNRLAVNSKPTDSHGIQRPSHGHLPSSPNGIGGLTTAPKASSGRGRFGVPPSAVAWKINYREYVVGCKQHEKPSRRISAIVQTHEGSAANQGLRSSELHTQDIFLIS